MALARPAGSFPRALSRDGAQVCQTCHSRFTTVICYLFGHAQREGQPLDLQLLIDSIVRQTTVLIAHLATAGGARAPLAEVANRVFLELADELHAQGVSRRVSADMFGMALRTYLRRIQRLRESATEQGRSLWEAIYGYLEAQEGLVTRGQILERFRHDDSELVKGILHDMCEAGLVLRLGKGLGAAFRSVSDQELSGLASTQRPSESLVWALIYREGPLTRVQLEQRTRGSGLGEVLAALVESGRVTRRGQGDNAAYATRHFSVPFGTTEGWEAAVFDHFQAMVRTIAVRLRGDAATSQDDAVGGSTFEMDVWPGHPLHDEVLAQLPELRQRLGDLRRRVHEFNAQHGRPDEYLAVTVYAGQCVTPESKEEGGEDA